MSFYIEKKYYINSIPGDYFQNTRHIIDIVHNDPSLDGYGMIISDSDVTLYNGMIAIHRGQEDGGKTFVFEKIEKIQGKRFPKYRFTEHDVIKMYDGAPHPYIDYVCEQEYNKFRVPGQLVYCTIISKSILPYTPENVIKGWGIIKDTDREKIYSLNYDLLAKTGSIELKSPYVIDYSFEYSIRLDSLLPVFLRKKEISTLLLELVETNDISIISKIQTILN